jgi:hypothetical protein
MKAAGDELQGIWVEEVKSVFPVRVHALCDGTALAESIDQPFRWWAIAADEEKALVKLTIQLVREHRPKPQLIPRHSAS